MIHIVLPLIIIIITSPLKILPYDSGKHLTTQGADECTSKFETYVTNKLWLPIKHGTSFKRFKKEALSGDDRQVASEEDAGYSGMRSIGVGELNKHRLG